jgi:hypothetical protein
VEDVRGGIAFGERNSDVMVREPLLEAPVLAAVRACDFGGVTGVLIL